MLVQATSSLAHDHALPPRRPPPILLLALARTLTTRIAVPAPAAAAIQLDAVAGTRDTVALARAAGSRAAGAAGRARVAAAGAEGRHVGTAIAVFILARGVVIVRFFELLGREAVRQRFHGLGVEFLVGDGACLVGLFGLGRFDLRGGERAAFGHVGTRVPFVA